jgi:type II secretory pathway pseudopilin PulG
MRKSNSINLGQMLIEVVVAVGIIALVFVGVSDLMTRSLRVVTFQRQRDEASTILQKIQNDYKAQRDTDPDSFYNTVDNNVTDPCVSGKPYKCTVIVEKFPNSITITVKAEWTDGGDPLSVSSIQSLARNVK